MYLYLCYVCIFSDKLQSVCKRKSAHFITFFCLQVGRHSNFPPHLFSSCCHHSKYYYIYIQHNANSKTIQQLCKILFRKKYIFFKCYILIYTILQDLFKFSELSSELEKNVIVVFFYDQTLHDCLSVAFFDYLEKGSIPWVIAETLKKRLSKDHIIRQSVFKKNCPHIVGGA